MFAHAQPQSAIQGSLADPAVCELLASLMACRRIALSKRGDHQIKAVRFALARAVLGELPHDANVGGLASDFPELVLPALQAVSCSQDLSQLSSLTVHELMLRLSLVELPPSTCVISIATLNPFTDWVMHSAISLADLKSAIRVAPGRWRLPCGTLLSCF